MGLLVLVILFRYTNFGCFVLVASLVLVVLFCCLGFYCMPIKREVQFLLKGDSFQNKKTEKLNKFAASHG